MLKDRVQLVQESPRCYRIAFPGASDESAALNTDCLVRTVNQWTCRSVGVGRKAQALKVKNIGTRPVDPRINNFFGIFSRVAPAL